MRNALFFALAVGCAFAHGDVNTASGLLQRDDIARVSVQHDPAWQARMRRARRAHFAHSRRQSGDVYVQGYIEMVIKYDGSQMYLGGALNSLVR